jgi:hypothetical protein
MEPKDLVDLEALAESVAPPSPSIFLFWTATAHEVCHAQHREFATYLRIYQEIPASELRKDQIVSFADALLRAMESDEQRKSWILAEALTFRKFEAS